MMLQPPGVVGYPPLSQILCRSNTPHQPKSFTIDAILGNSQAAIDYSTSAPGDRGEQSRRGKCKRVRTIFTPEQLERLEAEFERQQYMVGPERLYLAHALNLTEAQVKVWFQNRRIKWRKQHLEMQQQRLRAIKQQQQGSERGEESEESRGEAEGSSE